MSPPEPSASTQLRADVCIVGAGPAGLTVAHELAGSGLHVLLLESGPAHPPDGGVDVPSTHNVGLPYSPSATRSAGVGGSGARWDIVTPSGPDHVRLKELDPLDLEDRGLFAVGGWPLSYEELSAPYRRARALFGLPDAEPSCDAPVRGHVHRRRYDFARRTVFTHDVPAVLRSHPRTTLVTGHTVTDIRTAPGSDRVGELLGWSQTHGAFTVQASAFVLAGGGIENARLLLAARHDRPAGLGNHHDQVGRYFMEHPHYLAGVAVALPGRDLGASTAGWDLVERAGRPTQDKYAVDPDVLRREGLLNAVYKVQAHPVTAPLPFGHDGRVRQDAVDAYAAFRSAVRSRDARLVTPRQLARLGTAAPDLARLALRRARPRSAPGAAHPVSYRVRVMAEQEPSPSSRVLLGPARDALGVPEARLDWRLSDLDVRSMVRGQQLVASDLGDALGARVVTVLGREGEPRPLGGAHHMGTTRMSASPRTGVVDRDGRVHGVANLFVAGSSVFPTGGAANPTLTVVALAARLADHLRSELV